MSPNVGKQIYEARTAKGWSQDQLAAESRVGQSTIDRIERGASSKMETRAKVLRALDLAPENAFDRPENFRPLPQFFSDKALMPVFASAEGGDGSIVVSSEPYEYIPKPFTLADVSQAFAVLIEGESMCPAFEPGDKVWVNPMLSQRRDTDVILYGEKRFDGRALIKRLLTFNENEWKLRQYNPDQSFALHRNDWPICYRVVGKFSRA